MTADQGPEETGTEARPTRDAIVTAAFELFAENGYEGTTVADIVTRAGVGRRSFFRYFPTKEEVVFPDHEGALERMVEFLRQGWQDPDPVHRACEAARLVMQMYAADPEFSVNRYALTRTVPALKAYEKSVVWRYERALASYLEKRFAALPDGGARACAVAAGVVAAHNYGLRSWLRSGALGDVAACVDQALELVRRTWSQAEEPIVVIARSGTPAWRIVQQVEAAQREHTKGTQDHT
ncbi:TetR family transcriptional regulator [Streptomyces sp. NPDC059740]|uniref:TetR family transcriptional regulator n=1 Tax=Streptomyces sp. NPDC059740 TaxID=3346926 RepID=UPI0036532FFD